MLCGGFELCCIFMGRFEFVGVGNVDDFLGFFVWQQVSEFDLFTLDDIDSAFQNVTRLTYSQNHHLTGNKRFK